MPKIRWSTLAILTALLLALTLWPAGAGAQATCGPSHDSAVSAITGAQLGQGIERKLVTKVDNAWRMFQAGGKNGLKNALHQLDVALRLLDSPATKQIPPQTRDAVRHAIEDFQTCLVGGPPAETATLTVHTFLPSDASPDGKGDPAGAGVLVIVDGLELGVTGSDGVATVEVPAGTITVEARLYPSNVGTAEVTLAAGQSGQVDIILDEGKEPAEPTDLVLDESVDGVLPQAFSTFTLRFVKADDTTVQLSHLDEVELLDPNGGSSIFLQSQFALQPNGTVTATNPAALSSLFQARSGAIEMRMHGTDATGRTHDNLVRFYLSRFQVSGRLVAPPSFPGLDTSGIFITATILNTPLVFHAVSDGSGNFSFPLLPSGNLEIHSETFQNGKYYYGQGIAVLNRNLSVVVTMLYTDDLINGVPGFSVTSLLAAPKASTAPRLPFPAGSGSSTLGKDLLSPLAAAPASVSVNVTAGPQNVPITSAVTFNILKGTKEATLKYRIQTDEYPYYVLSQSIYNDTWSLNVRGGSAGQQLFDISRQINSQLSVPPVWQGDGTTGEIQEVLNVEALAANADVTLTLFASAMNVGDSILPTRVSASLSAETGLSIKSITPDTVTPTTGDSSFYSIPRPGSTNTYSRWFTLKITKPMNSTVTKMTSKLLGPGELMTIVDGPPGASFQVVDDQTLKVRVTMHDQASTVESTPPPAHNTKYRFKLAVDDNGTELTDEKDSGGRHALWRMPDGFGRYSTRDTGGDDWCSRGTYNWMDTNRSLLKEINDISGEHARNLGHATHQYGTDIDMFHFYRFPGATSGGNNYTRLQADTALSIRINDPDATVRQQAAAARARVSSWVTETRSGIDALAALNTVSSVLYAQGSAGSGLPAGWAQSLLTTGATTVGGAALDLGLGTWSNAKYRPRSDHNDHVHITLNRAALGD